MSKSFGDHFSQKSQSYAQYRPEHPRELYAYLASITPGTSMAWDCGTGSGQAAVGLADYFDRVYATDASASQISAALPHAKVEYHVEPAEEVALPEASVDLVTVAVAIHWFNFDEFYREVKRVLKPDGILAAWGYSRAEIAPEIDELTDQYHEIIRDYWPEDFKYYRERYQTIPFPFEEVIPSSFSIEVKWNLDQFTGFLDSWSASLRCKEKLGHHPLEIIWPKLVDAWGDENELHPIRMPLFFRVGRNPSSD